MTRVPTVLVVEDNEITRRMYCVALRTLRIHVVEAADIATALALAAAEEIDLVVQDLSLPDGDGFELAARLRALPGLRGVPIVAVSGFISKVEQARTSTVGFVDHLFKPVDPDRLIAIVRALVLPEGERGGSGRRLLIVDDDETQARLLGLLCRQAGYETTTATDGGEALRKALSDPPDLIVSDVLMPVKDGFRLALDVRSHPELARVPVLLISAAFVEDEDRRLALDVGASDLIERSPDPEGLFDAIERVLAAPPAPLPSGLDPNRAEDYAHRMIRQLERQLGRNAELSGRLALQEAALAVLARLGEPEPEPRSLDETILELLRHALDAAGVSIGAVYLREEDGSLALRAQHGFGERASPATFFDRLDLLEHAVRTREPVTVDTESDDDGWVGLLARAGARALLLAPLALGDETLGVLVLAAAHSRLGCEWAPFARAVGAQITHAVALTRAVTRLAESEALFKQIAENVRDVFWIVSPDPYAVRYVSPAYEEIWGRPASALQREPLAWIEAVHPDDRARVEAVIARQFEAEIEVVFRVLRPDGSVRWVRKRAAPVRNNGGATPRVAGIATDITDLKRAERQLLLLQTITAGVGQAETASAALAVVLESVREAIGWGCLGQVWLPSDDGTVLECAHATSDDAAELASFRAASQRTTLRSGQCLVGQAFASRQPAWIEDTAGSAFDPRPNPDSSGLRSGLLVPMLAGDEVVAVVEIYSRERREREPWTIELVTSVGSQLGAVIRRKLVEDRLRKTETQLLRAQKMEAVGRLAGGVAHDMNNMLTAILGFSEIVLNKLPPDDPLRTSIRQIERAGQRGAALTRQLLVFSRHEAVAPQVLAVGDVLRDTETMLRRLIGEDIEVEIRLEASLDEVWIDRGQLEQVILNLCVNSRDAMQRGGRLTIATADAELDGDETEVFGRVRPGRHVRLSVADTGSGIDPEVIGQMFEPFFTTKPVGKGTGLGLSTVYGIVESAHGCIAVESEVGAGTTFDILLPLASAEERATARGRSVTPPEEPARPRRKWRVLLVEDEDTVRALTEEILTMEGFEVVSARDGAEALRVAEQAGRIDLVLSDVVMPHVSGPALVARLREKDPELRVVFFSGYTDGALEHLADVGSDSPLVQKPFTPRALVQKVREVLRTRS